MNIVEHVNPIVQKKKKQKIFLTFGFVLITTERSFQNQKLFDKHLWPESTLKHRFTYDMEHRQNSKI